MPGPFATNVVPELLQWWGIGAEKTAAGTIAPPTMSIPLEKGLPDDIITMIVDKSITGDMGEDRGDIAGTGTADFPLSGLVYLDSIGHLLYNLWGDYIATGSTPTNSTTLTAPLTPGQTTATVASIVGLANGQSIQIGVTGDGNPEIVVLSIAPSGSTITFTNTPARFSHASGKVVATVVAPYTHTFSLLNSGNGQPTTHTITYHNNLTTSTLARQYAFWCASGIDLTMTSTDLFKHETKGTALLGVPAGVAPTNTQTGLTAEPNWRFSVGIGGPATGGTQVVNVCEATLNMARMLKPQFGMQGLQAPLIIPRIGVSVTGKLTFMAQDESPLIAFLANTQQQLQLTMSDGSGATLRSFTFNAQIAAYEKASITAGDVMEWTVPFRCIKNTTNAGQSGALSPASIILVNAIPTY